MEVRQPGVKEETFIQVGKRVGDRQPVWRDSAARQWLEDHVAPHLCADKPEGTTGERDRPCNPAFQWGEINP